MGALQDGRVAMVALAWVRVALGTAALVAPQLAGRAWIGAGATGADRAVLVRALGGRDIALGAGAILAARRGGRRGLRTWIAMGAMSDFVDTVATAAAFGALPARRRWLVLFASAGASLSGLAGYARLARTTEPPADTPGAAS